MKPRTPSPAQRRILEFMRDNPVAILGQGHMRLEYWTFWRGACPGREIRVTNTTFAILLDRGWIEQRKGTPFEITCVLSDAGRAVLEPSEGKEV